MTESFDSTNKEAWRKSDLATIAHAFGFIANDNFVRALEEFLPIVKKAAVCTVLGSVAVWHFRDWKPPLEKELPFDGSVTEPVSKAMTRSDPAI